MVAGVVTGIAARNARKLVRFGSEAEAIASKEAGKLLPKPGHVGQPKWIGLEGTIDPGKLGQSKNYTYKVTMNMRQDMKEWLNNSANTIMKPNEPGRWGIKAEKLSEFNSQIESLTVKKR